MSPNLFVLHGSQGLDPTHPDGSGGRVMVLFGPDGILMVDTQNRQVAEQTLFFATQGALIHAQENLRNEMLRPPRRGDGQLASPPDMAGIPIATYRYDPATNGEPALTLVMNGETVDFIPMMTSHTAGDTIVRFRKANAIYIEDFYRNFGYPYADRIASSPKPMTK
jgi:cyclase